MRRDIRLWLHEGTLEGSRTAFEGEAFLSRLSCGEAGRGALTELGDREAVLVLTGPDALPGRTVAAVAAGSVAEVAGACLPDAVRTPFASVIVLGLPGAARFESIVRSRVGAQRSVVFLDGKPAGTETGPLPESWTALAGVFGDMPAWLMPSVAEGRSDFGRAYPGMALFCRGRGADARARLTQGGIRILAGSRCSASDATPSLIGPLREAIKRLVDEGSLVKTDGVWQFARDVELVSPVQAASIVMRTSAGAAHWETEEGDSLADRLNAKYQRR